MARPSADVVVHGLSLGGGLGWFPSDFAIGEVTGEYGLGFGGGVHHFIALQGHFRMLIDAFEWVPSIGPVAGVTFFSAPQDSAGAMVDLGLEACVAWRGSRESSWKACGTMSLVPTSDHYDASFTIGVGFDGFFGL